MIRGIAKWHVFIPNEAFFGHQKRTWVTWGKTTTYPHNTGKKISQFFKVRASMKFEV